MNKHLFFHVKLILFVCLCSFWNSKLDHLLDYNFYYFLNQNNFRFSTITYLYVTPGFSSFLTGISTVTQIGLYAITGLMISTSTTTSLIGSSVGTSTNTYLGTILYTCLSIGEGTYLINSTYCIIRFIVKFRLISTNKYNRLLIFICTY